jgi:aminopeptidase-like protein
VHALSDFTSFRKNPKIEEAPLHGELMLFDGVATKFFVLNQTMAFLWRHCDGTKSFSDVLERLGQDFAEVETATAEVDLRKALEELVSLGLVVDARSLEAGTASA